MKRHLAPKAILTLLLCLLVCLPAAAGKKLDDLRAAVEAMSEELMKATVEGDYETALAGYTDDAVSMPNYHGILEGIEAIRGYHEGMAEAGITFPSIEFDTLDLWTCGGLVYETGTFSIAVAIPGMPEPMQDDGKYLTVYEDRKKDGLKIKTEIWNSDHNPWTTMQQGAMSDEEKKEIERLLKAKQAVIGIVEGLSGSGIVGLDGEWDEKAGGYRIDEIAKESTARAVGVVAGDLLVKMNGIRLDDVEGRKADAPNRLPGKEATITILRDGEEQTLDVTLIAVGEDEIAEEIGKFILKEFF